MCILSYYWANKMMMILRRWSSKNVRCTGTHIGSSACDCDYFSLRWSMLGRELCLRLSQHRRQLSLSLASTADQRQADPAVAIFCLSVRHTLMLCSNNWLLSSRIRANSGLLVPNMERITLCLPCFVYQKQNSRNLPHRGGNKKRKVITSSKDAVS